MRPVHPVGERNKLQAPAFLEMKLTGGPPRADDGQRTDGRNGKSETRGRKKSRPKWISRSAGGNEASVGRNNETVLKRSRSHLGLIIMGEVFYRLFVQEFWMHYLTAICSQLLNFFIWMGGG